MVMTSLKLRHNYMSVIAPADKIYRETLPQLLIIYFCFSYRQSTVCFKARNFCLKMRYY